MIKFKNVTATYKKNKGIFNINFEVKPKEIVFVMGPTGAGKSTVLRSVYRELNIDSGRIYFGKENITNCSHRKTSILRRAFLPDVIGQPVILLLKISNWPSLFCASQVQPDPKIEAAEIENSTLNSLKDPNDLSMALTKLLLRGIPPPFGLIQFQ